MIGFVVEDPALQHIATEVSRKLRIVIRKENIRLMDGDDLEKAKRYVRDLVERRRCQRVVVLKDKLGAPPDVEERFTRMGFASQSVLVLAVGEAESWFLADHEAISEYLQARVRSVSNPESLLHPKERLKSIFKSHRKAYNEGGRDPQELAQRMRPEVVAPKCPSFQKLIDVIQG